MKPYEKEAIQKEISQRIEQTRKTIESLKKQIKPIPLDGTIGRITRMDAIAQRGIFETSLAEAEDSLVMLEYARDNLDKPDFAICLKCQQSIPLERILAIPETKLCVNCASY